MAKTIQKTAKQRIAQAFSFTCQTMIGVILVLSFIIVVARAIELIAGV